MLRIRGLCGRAMCSVSRARVLLASFYRASVYPCSTTARSILYTRGLGKAQFRAHKRTSPHKKSPKNRTNDPLETQNGPQCREDTTRSPDPGSQSARVPPLWAWESQFKPQPSMREHPVPTGQSGQSNPLRLPHNPFTGCVPQALRNVANHDLDDLSMSYCQLPGHLRRKVTAQLPAWGVVGGRASAWRGARSQLPPREGCSGTTAAGWGDDARKMS